MTARASQAQPIRGIAYRNPRWPGLGLETMRLTELWERVHERHFERPQRPDFHHLILCTEGQAWHQIDFVRHELEPTVLLHVQPGQVQTWQHRSGAEALMIIFAPDFLLPERSGAHRASIGDSFWPTALRIPDHQYLRIFGAFQDLHREYQGTDGSTLSISLLRHLLHAVLLRLRQIMVQVDMPPDTSSSLAEVFRLFRQEVEKAFLLTRSIEDYAERLGYSSRTLSRAAEAKAGMTAKAYVDARVLLEGKRLLAHSDLSVAQIAYQLGFSEATNFAKFFRKGAGVGPGTFRASMGI